MEHMYIPDAQVHPGTCTDHIKAAGKMMLKLRPDVVVIGGDWWDFPSLETYSPKQKIGYDHRNYLEDYKSGIAAMEIFLAPLKKYNARQKKNRKGRYTPRLVFCQGNHEERVDRLLKEQTQLIGALPRVEDYLLAEGFSVHLYKTPVQIDGVTYCHICPQTLSAGAVGRAHLIAAKRHTSWTTAHIQIFDYHISPHLPRLQCIIAGAFYMHDEEYKHGSNDHFRGLVYKKNVLDGTYDPLFLSIQGLLKEYG